ncbi:MAG TPA: ATP-grasp domain-containing protein [Candidatus Dormibacteraeota bacterium]|nr:ATP-grasp domain-containing protein [Candidatus Dormibacteraeota bacterium]
MKILVLDGNQNQAVASVRSLARAGHQVVVGESGSWSKAGWSRDCRGTFQYPNPEKDAIGFVARVLEEARREPGTLVLPMTEATTLPLSAQRENLLSAGAKLVLPPHTEVLRAFNKDEMVRLAASLGIAVPKTIVVSKENEARSASDVLKFPVVLKPCSSVEAQSGGAVRVTGRPRYATNSQELMARHRELAQICSQMLIQEFVDGEGTGYFALMRQGELRAEFAHRRIRDVHPTGSGSAVRVSVEPDPEVRRASLAILQALCWHGVAMVEFRQVAGGPPVFMEVNGRFWNSLPLACYAGADFPAWLAEMATNGDVEQHLQYRTGISSRWLLGDFRHLLEVWRGKPEGYPRPYPGRLRTLMAVLTPTPGMFHDNFQWRDPLPEFGDWLNFLKRVFERARS